MLTMQSKLSEREDHLASGSECKAVFPEVIPYAFNMLFKYAMFLGETFHKTVDDTNGFKN